MIRSGLVSDTVLEGAVHDAKIKNKNVEEHLMLQDNLLFQGSQFLQLILNSVLLSNSFVYRLAPD